MFDRLEWEEYDSIACPQCGEVCSISGTTRKRAKWLGQHPPPTSLHIRWHGEGFCERPATPGPFAWWVRLARWVLS